MSFEVGFPKDRHVAIFRLTCKTLNFWVHKGRSTNVHSGRKSDFTQILIASTISDTKRRSFISPNHFDFLRQRELARFLLRFVQIGARFGLRMADFLA